MSNHDNKPLKYKENTQPFIGGGGGGGGGGYCGYCCAVVVKGCAVSK
jgi:hypothetical protein